MSKLFNNHGCVGDRPPEIKDLDQAQRWIKLLYCWLQEDENYINNLVARVEALEKTQRQALP